MKYHGAYFWGSLDSYWIAYYLFPHLFLRKMHTDKQMDLLNSWAMLAKNCFWWYPFENICFVSDRPTRISMDSKWRMHDEYAPAVEFSDGWKIYAINGVMVPEWVVEHPEDITVKSIDDEKNAEVRRIMMKRFGFAKYCQKRGAKLIDKNSNNIFGELWEYVDIDNVKIQFVHCINGTPEIDGTNKWYDLRVRPRFSNVVEAIASTYPDVTMEEFLLMSEYRS